MELKALLDADMATIAGWLRSGFAWWVDELRGMLPARFAVGGAAFAGWFDYAGQGQMVRAGEGAAQAVLIAPELCLVREIELPPLGQRDLERLVRLDADRIMPIPAERLVLAARADPAERSRVTVAALPLDTARALLEELDAHGLQPGCIALAIAAQPGVAAVDFTSALAEAGLVAKPRSAAAGWWALVAFLFALNLGVLVWRDAQSVSQLQDLVDSQAPAVNAARAIANRISATERQAQELAALRRKQDALTVLAAATMALPPGAWVQRYAWDGATLRLSGYKRAGVDVVGALRKSPRLADVRAGNSGEVAEVLTGQPFDVTAVVRDAPAREVGR
jgi:hypothetical protein